MINDVHETKYLVFKRTKLKKKVTYNIKIHNKSGEFLGEIY
jgi:hypothetical protein